jgi:phosphonopyruvate decarboxylase
MIDIEKFFNPLVELGYKYYTGVPCSFFKSAINYAIANDKTDFYMAANEGSAVAMGAGAYLAGNKAVIMMQNSGFANTISPLTSLNYIYDIPVMLLVSARGFGVKDEPQHELMGAQMTEIMDSIRMKWEIIPENEDEWPEKVKAAQKYMDDNKQPFIWIAKKGCISKFPSDEDFSDHTLNRNETIKWITEQIENKYKDAAIIATTGMIGRELYEINDRKKNFYMMGSMGHASALALGFAQSRENIKTFVLDGDGAIIMHAGILSTIGHYNPGNFYHILIDNQAHQSTGNQKTTSQTTDFRLWAKEAGYKYSFFAKNQNALDKFFDKFLESSGPSFFRIFVNSKPKEGTPRITESYTAKDIANNFKSAFTD